MLPAFREYERCSTTVIDAYLSPLLGRYLTRLALACEEAGIPEPAVMRSSGGTAPAVEAARAGAWSVLSGPAGGAVGAGLLARLSGAGGDAIGIDMGGTSCDVCVVEAGEVRRTDAREIEGRPIQLPMVDVHTVGAGGGSIGWRDPGGALRVGPRSAGAEPGPACYGLGGTEPTVTDANLVLGYLAPDSALAGGVELDVDAARAALARLGDELGLDETETAEGIVRVANQEMVRALRVVTVERGIDPRGFALLPFGGAGPMHAAALADELGMDRIVCPRASGVLSALGLIAAGRRRDTARTILISGDEITAERLAREVDELAARVREGLPDPRIEVVYDLRYRGQAFELPVPGPARPDPAALAEAFAREHEARYGYRDPGAELELVNVRVAAIVPGPEPRPSRRRRRARWPRARGGRASAADWIETRALRGEPPAGFTAAGPCVFELPEATLVLPPGGAPRWTRPARSRPGARTPGSARVNGAGVDPVDPAGDGRRAARRLRGDGGGADPLGALGEHHRAPRLLDRALRRPRRAGDAGRAHPRPPRLDARRGRRDRRRGAARGRSLDPQRPLPRRHPPPRHHADLPGLRRGRAGRVRGEPRPSRRRRGPDPGRDAGRLRHPRRGGRGDLAARARTTPPCARSPRGCGTRTSGSRTCGRSARPT